MATVKHRIGELDVVELLDHVGAWPSGSVGAVVSDWGEMKQVEISDDEHYGATVDLIAVHESRLRLISKHSA
jgi:hypothetical protein